MKSFGWDECRERGEAGVDLLVAHLKSQGHRVVDVSSDPIWQKRDVDLLVDDMMIEIKTDSHKPVNLFFELTCDGKPGGVFQSRAQDWIVFFPESGIAYWLSLPHLQRWLVDHAGGYKKFTIHNHRGTKEKPTSTWLAVGIAVPVADLLRDGVPVKTLQIGGSMEEM